MLQFFIAAVLFILELANIKLSITTYFAREI